MNPTSALTWRANGIARVIPVEVGVSVPFLGEPGSIKIESFKGVWDTGASASAISATIVQKLDLKPTGQTVVNTANGPHTTNTYLVNLSFPANLAFQNVVVNEAKLGSNIDMLVGMDIITMGDFSITNFEGRTVMSFQVPSCVDIDFVQRMNDRNVSLGGQTHGPAHKKKKRRK